MDTVPSKDLAEQISDILKAEPGVIQLQEVQAHRFGPHSVVNVTIGIDGSIPVRDGDLIANKVESLLYNQIPNLRRVHVHYHPADDEHHNMTIEQILAESRRHISDYQPEYFE